MISIFNPRDWKGLLVAVVLILSLVPLVGFAHPGRTDRSGCHTCRTNCRSWGLRYGEYHCHRSKGLPQPKKQIKSKKLYYQYEKNISNNFTFSDIGIGNI